MTTLLEREVKAELLQQEAARTSRSGRSRAPADRERKAEEYVWAALRFGVGWIFLWAFLDKVFGLGFATEAGKGWISGGSPTFGFLKFGTTGPLAEF